MRLAPEKVSRTTVLPTDARYKYIPLSKKVSDIRLITLLPGTFGSEIHIKPETTVLSDSQVPQFQALLYIWDSTENTVGIWIEGVDGCSKLAVTRDLKEALQSLQYHNGGSHVLSNDAI